MVMTHSAGRRGGAVAPPVADAGATPADPSPLDVQPAGDRYYRHPGDAVRLVLLGLAVALLAGFVWLGTDTAQGLTSDFEGTVSRVPTSIRQLALALAQVGAVAAP